MTKIITTITAAAFLGAATLAPVPASAFVPLFFVPVLMAKKDPNFKAHNPYAKKVSVKHRKHRR